MVSMGNLFQEVIVLHMLYKAPREGPLENISREGWAKYKNKFMQGKIAQNKFMHSK